MLSIVVPIYNVEQYLPKCIDSLLGQTWKDIEIILVDDGSPDNCGKICDDYRYKDSRIKVIHKENGGLVSAWTRGVTEATGDYVGFVDSDDYCDSDYFDKIMSAILGNHADIGIGGYVEEKPKHNEEHKVGSHLLNEGLYNGEKLETIKKDFFRRRGQIIYARWLHVMKRSLVVDNLHLVDLNIKVGEDIGIALATLFDAKSIVLVSTTGYHYVWRESSLLHKFSDTEIDNYTRLCKNIEMISNGKGYDSYLHREFAAQMTLVISKILGADLMCAEKLDYLKRFRENEFVKRVFEKKDYGKCSWKRKTVLWLFENRRYRILTLLPVC